MEQILAEILYNHVNRDYSTSLLRKHTGLNSYRGFDSHRLLQELKALDENQGLFFFGRIGSSHFYWNNAF